MKGLGGPSHLNKVIGGGRVPPKRGGGGLLVNKGVFGTKGDLREEFWAGWFTKKGGGIKLGG